MDPYTYNAEVVSVIDGDTIHANIDLGFGIWNRGWGKSKEGATIRFVGCNARELSAPGGPEAKSHLETVLPSGLSIVLRSVTWDKYGGRVDAEIQMADGSDLVQTLVSEQWVAAWDGVGVRPSPPWPRTVASRSA